MTSNTKKPIIKYTVILLAILFLLCILCFAYINNRSSFYNSPEYKKNIVMSYNICGYNSYDCWGSGGNIIFINIKLNDEPPVISVSNSDPEHHTVKEHKLNKFEVYLLCDMANYMLKLNGRMDEKYTQKYSMYWDVYAYNDTPPYLSGEITAKCSESLKVNLFLFAAMSVFYKYVVWALLILYLTVVFIIYKCIRNISKPSCDSAGSKLYRTFKIPQTKFMLLSLLPLILYAAIYIPIYKRQIDVKMQTAPFVPFEAAGTDIRIGIIYSVICLIILICVFKTDRIRAAVSYILSTSAVLWYQYVYFKEKNLYIGAFNIVPAKAIKFDMLLFSEAIPFYPRLFYFTLFFVISLIIHYILLIILLKDNHSSKFLWAVIFAVNNSFLVMLTGYVAQYILRLV